MSSQSEAKQAYQEKVKAEIDKLNAQIDELKAKAAQAKAETSVEYNSQLEELYVKRDTVQAKLAEIQQAGEEAWQELTAGFEKAIHDLSTGVESALAKFMGEKKQEKESTN
jgi:Ribonuclease G/E